ncbi:MAG: DUF4832 domain-containing protein, partial [Pseudomonadota bacterium]|nr:DUF4832 domain-containing protein [Pseudomonadota bacterium]
MSCVFAMVGPAQAVITNTATAQGTYLGQPVSSAPVTVNVPVAPPKPAIGIVKTGTFNDINGNGFADVNDTITYAFSVSNLGSVTLTNISATDNKIGAVACVLTTLIPNQTTTCSGPVYHLTQADVDAGSVSNQATVTAKAPDGTVVTDLSDPTMPGVGHDNPTVTKLIQKPIVGLVKTAGAIIDANSDGKVDAGDQIKYSFTISNLGDVTLSAIAVTDIKVGPVTCLATTLAPAATTTCSAANYTLTQADMDAGQASNQASVTANPPTGAAVSDLSDPVTSGPAANAPTVTPLAATSSMTVAKLDTLSGAVVAGTPITYKFTIKNTGTVSLHNITLSDAGATVSGGPIVNLAPGVSDTVTFTGSHPLTAADIAAGSYTNTVTATATPAPPASANITANGSATTTLNTNASMTFTKSGVLANGPATPPKAGDKVNYTLVVTNTGPTPLFNVSVSDPLLASAAASAQQMVALLD